ncbi:DUF3291 domain-containing protein [Chloroflexi bacterium TSY]|nr:DUF3291 domain-containing protein [Chloroflexi bacterium TSY]
MTSYQLAQLNIAQLKYAINSPEMSDFVNNLDRINALADSAPGFVWRLQTEDGDATSIRFFGSDTLVNMSIWEDVASLHDYVYRTAHAEIMSRRKEWFERMEEAYTVLWWIPKGKIPSLNEAKERLEKLRLLGPTIEAFTFKKVFPPPDMQKVVPTEEFDDLCPAI